MMTEKYKVVLMDIDGTLLDFDQAETDGIRQVMKAYGVCPDREKRKSTIILIRGCGSSLSGEKFKNSRLWTPGFTYSLGAWGLL